MNMHVYEKVRAVPQEALKPIQGGRLKGMSDINPMWRIKMLTEVFGMCGIGWKTVIVNQRLERGGGDEVVCFVDILLHVKVDGEWSEGIPGMGGSSFITAERNGLYTSDECYKMAYTDAISVACKSLGFAADVYFEKDRTKYTQGEEQQQPQTPAQAPQRPQLVQNNQPAQTQQRQQTTPQNGTQKPISEAQIKLVATLKTRKGMPEDIYRDVLATYGVESTKELSSFNASKLIERLNAYLPPANEVIDVSADDLPF